MESRDGAHALQDDVLAEVLRMCPEANNQKVCYILSLHSTALSLVQHMYFALYSCPSYRMACSFLSSTSYKPMDSHLQGVQDVLEALQQDRAAAQAAMTRSAVHSFPLTARMWARVRSLVLLVLIAWSLPISLALVAGGIAYDWACLLAAGKGDELKRRLRVARGGSSSAWRGTAIVSGVHPFLYLVFAKSKMTQCFCIRLSLQEKAGQKCKMHIVKCMVCVCA